MAIEIDLDALDEGEWFPYQNSHFDQETGEWIFEEPHPEAKVRVRRMESLVRERFYSRKKVAEHVLNPKTKAMERITYYKEPTSEESRKESEDTWDYVITGFEGFANKGKLIEYTRENKIKMMRDPAFDRFVGRCLRILDGSEERRREEAKKN